MSKNPWVGNWTYRSLLNDPDGSLSFDKLEFGEGTIVINDDDSLELLAGTIGGEGWDIGGSRLHGQSAAYDAGARARKSGAQIGALTPGGHVTMVLDEGLPRRGQFPTPLVEHILSAGVSPDRKTYTSAGKARQEPFDQRRSARLWSFKIIASLLLTHRLQGPS